MPTAARRVCRPCLPAARRGVPQRLRAVPRRPGSASSARDRTSSSQARPSLREPLAPQNGPVAAASRSSSSSSRSSRAQASAARTVLVARPPRASSRRERPIAAPIEPCFRPSATRYSACRRRSVGLARPTASSRSSAYSRIVSSGRERGSPPGRSSWRSRLFAISDSSTSSSASQTASAASSVQPPAKTARRANSCLLRSREQVVAPVDRAAERLLARRQVARPARQQLQAVLEPGEHRCGRRAA